MAARIEGAPADTQPEPISTRDKISAAAFEILADDGYEAASVSAIAKRAGVSTGTVYQHFTDKREIIDTAFDDAVTALVVAIDPDATLALLPEGREQTVELLRTLAQRALQFVQTEPRIIKFIVAQSSSNDIEIRQRVLGLEAMVVSRISQGVRRAVQHGWIEADDDSIDLVSRALLMLIIPILYSSLDDSSEFIELAELMHAYEHIIRAGVLREFDETHIAALDSVLDNAEEVGRRVSLILAHPGDRRSRLLDSALELYSTYGYRGVKPADIASHAGFGYGTFYNYFDNRRECLQQVLERELMQLSWLFDFTRPVPATEAEFVTDMAALVMRINIYVEDRSGSLVGLLLDSIGIDPAATEYIVSTFLRFGQWLGEYLARCRDRGVIREGYEPEAAGQLLMSMLTAACIHHVQEPMEARSTGARMVTATIVRTLCSGADHRL